MQKIQKMKIKVQNKYKKYKKYKKMQKKQNKYKKCKTNTKNAKNKEKDLNNAINHHDKNPKCAKTPNIAEFLKNKPAQNTNIKSNN